MRKKTKLANICDLIDEKILLNKIINHNLFKMNYISTENMLPDKNGIIPPKSISSIGKGCKYKTNDTLLSNIRPYFKKIWLAKNEGACSNDVLIFRAKESYYHDFLYYNLANDAFFEYAMKTSKGTKMPRGDKTAIKQYDIYDFDYRTQQKLTKLLRLLDDKIELNRQINTNLEQQAQAIFKEMFIDNGLKNVKKGMLQDIAEITMGLSPDGSSYNEKQLGIIFFQGRAEFSDRFPKIRLYTSQPKRMAMRNDILMSVRAPVGDINIAHHDCCIGRGLASIRSKYNHQSFLFYTMLNLKKYLDRFNSEGTVFGAISKDALNTIPIDIPSEGKIKHFEQTASPIDTCILNNYKEICCLESLRDTLLPKLMSGEIDVSKIELE